MTTAAQKGKSNNGKTNRSTIKIYNRIALLLSLTKWYQQQYQIASAAQKNSDNNDKKVLSKYKQQNSIISSKIVSPAENSVSDNKIATVAQKTSATTAKKEVLSKYKEQTE